MLDQDVLVAQVETADVLVLNKGDLLTEAQLSSLQQLLAQLNPAAVQHVTKYGRTPLQLVLGTGARQKQVPSVKCVLRETAIRPYCAQSLARPRAFAIPKCTPAGSARTKARKSSIYSLAGCAVRIHIVCVRTASTLSSAPPAQSCDWLAHATGLALERLCLDCRS
jgi:G3E family GTPase